MAMTQDEIATAVAQFPRWHYEFDLRGVTTPIHDRQWINRHRQRKRYFFDPLAQAGIFRGKRVLDLGCNAGFWAMHAIAAGCAHVVGVDAREMHIGQANLVFRALDIPVDRYRFIHDNVFTGDTREWGGPFDIVLCLGLLYHVCKPMELMERIAALNTDILVIDSTVLNDPRSLIELRHEPLEDPRMSADYQLVFLPSPAAVHDMAVASGYACHTLAPRFDDWEGCADFAAGDRYTFACAKHADLGTVYGNVLASSPRPA